MSKLLLEKEKKMTLILFKRKKIILLLKVIAPIEIPKKKILG
jgi:hypothetical protein